MIHKVIKKLLNTTKSLETVIDDNTTNIEEILDHVDTCSSCSQWKYKKDLEPDLDGFPTCKVCLEFYGY